MSDTQRQQYSEKQKVKIFDEEFLPHIDSMYNFAYRLTFDEDDAKDLVQETYLKAFRFIDSFQEGTNAKAWLFRILKNSFINDFRKGYLDNGLIQIRIIPIGLRSETRAQAAFLLAVPNPQERWYRHLDGEEGALPITPGLNETAVERNFTIMQSWRFDVTPLSVYRARNGEVKIIQGRAKSISKLLNDLSL